MTAANATPAAAPLEAGSLRRRATSAASWRLGAYASARAIAIVSNIVLARLLAPTAFGVVAIADALVRGLQMFSEIGIGPAIVQSKRDADDPAFLRTAWTMQVLRGFVLAVVTAALAIPLARLYDDPLLAGVMAVVSLSLILQGFNSTRYFTLSRSLAERRRSVIDLLRAVVTRGAMIAWALVSPTAWALVGGTLIGTAFYTVATHMLGPGPRDRFGWDRQAAKELFGFGGWIFLGTVIAFFSQQADKLMLGKLLTIELVGVYAIALAVSRIPQELSAVMSQNVLFPLFSEMVRQDPDRFAARLRRVRRVVLLASAALTLAVVVAAPLFFELLYRPAYHAAMWIAPLATLPAWVLLLTNTSNKILLGMGDSRSVALNAGVRLVGFLIGSIGGYVLGLALFPPAGGGPAYAALAGFIAGSALGLAVGHAHLLWMLWRRGMSFWRQDALLTAGLLVAGGAAFAADFLLSQRLGGGTVAIAARAGSGALLILAVSLPVLVVVRRELSPRASSLLGAMQSLRRPRRGTMARTGEGSMEADES